MAGNNLGNAPSLRRTDTVICDTDGTEILCIGMAEMTLRHADGTVEVLKSHDNILLGDGSIWSGAMMLGKPPVLLAVCRYCRSPIGSFPWRGPPSHGLLRLTMAKLCTCGEVTCPKHRKHVNGRWRCLRCARHDRVKGLISRLLFSEE